MFETSEIGRAMAKGEYDEAVPGLRTALLKAQAALEVAQFPVLVLLNGADAAGKGETLNRLYEWLDARYLSTFVYTEPNEAERERPEYWRYFMAMPPRGRLGLFLGNWYSRPILSRTHGKLSDAQLYAAIGQINAFERALVDDGALIIKLWFHISKKEQHKRLKRLESSKATRFRVTERDWKHHELYKDFVVTSEQVLRATTPGIAPWNTIEATDDRYRDFTTASIILNQLEQRLARPARPPEPPQRAPAIADPATIFDKLDQSTRIEKSEYDKQAPLLQARLNRLARRLEKKKRSAIFLFEGPDAAGKGGAIRRIIWALDARQHRIIPVAAPTDEERARHYLWRFWRHLPGRGRITIYDRSWYGRVLVERVEGFATEAEWMRAYQEINDFEAALVNDGIVLVKFWLHITPEEQLRRFEAREREPWKQHKIGPEDYRNRAHAHQYELAASDMIARSSTAIAPFTIVPADDKRRARLEVLETICERLKQELG